VLDALENKKSIRSISTQDNNLTLIYKEEGHQVVERLKKNFSLIQLSFQHNFFDQEFADAVKNELSINQKIVDIILP